jgi:hypothetical protein
VLLVEDKRQIVLRVIFGPEVALLIRAVWARPLARVVYPADEIIVIVLLAHAAQIRSKRAANGI